MIFPVHGYKVRIIACSDHFREAPLERNSGVRYTGYYHRYRPSPMPLLRCPLCRHTLLTDDSGVVCANQHRFDRAREGYLNLLPVQKKNSLRPGDDVAMVQARRQFLEAGHYQPLLDALLTIIKPLQPACLLDAGCGEGWYTAAMATQSAHTVAFDISKEAIKKAAKHRPQTTWLVASSHDIPLPDSSIDVMTAIFTPVITEEAARLLRPSATLIIAAPGEQHLQELREALYTEVRPHQSEKWDAQLAPHFSLLSRQRVQFTMELIGNAAVKNLLLMTPHYWRASREKRTAVEQLERLSVQADFWILVFRREASPAQPLL